MTTKGNKRATPGTRQDLNRGLFDTIPPMRAADDSFTKFNNTVLERLYTLKLRQDMYRTVLFIVRKTTGYNKPNDEDTISISQFVKEMKMTKRTVLRALTDLINQNIVIKTKTKTICSYAINKDVYNWQTCDTGVTPPVTIIDVGGDKSGSELVTPVRHTKEINTITKEKGLCKIPEIKGLTDNDVFKIAMKKGCFDCTNDCRIYGKLMLIKMRRGIYT